MRTTVMREEMRDAIMSAADRLIERYGYRKMTMDDVAREAGVGKGTIYLYFPSKEELALSSADRMFAGIIQQLVALARTGGPAVERLRRMMVARVLLRFDAAQRFAQSLDEVMAALRPSLMARRERWLDEEAKVFAEVIVQGQREGSFGPGDVMATACTLLIATNALMPFNLSPKELGERDDIELRARRVTEIMLYGLLVR